MGGPSSSMMRALRKIPYAMYNYRPAEKIAGATFSAIHLVYITRPTSYEL